MLNIKDSTIITEEGKITEGWREYFKELTIEQNRAIKEQTTYNENMRHEID